MDNTNPSIPVSPARRPTIRFGACATRPPGEEPKHVDNFGARFALQPVANSRLVRRRRSAPPRPVSLAGGHTRPVR
ncbi:hypothetical protein Tdes44962_MAKER06953 [Teratosphaeria destructans]|uniref:Uncharacterized protein n=1 Tax=Teratosphaeria destructans TaxID=418781 RepID=A0A9W7W6V0_9PEZI|nr:hypothetical protein Tdes44962_MAKER06953 [Teratosphaeria destructans]